MRCLRQNKYSKLEISSLWEVHLEEDLWQKIKIVAKEHKASFSWITRYCVFRLARKKNLSMRKAMEIHNKKIKIHQKSVTHHRHLMCLYGSDEKLLRIAAMQLGMTVSQMIRLALHWFLPKLEKKITKWEHIYYHGTKICQHLSLTRSIQWKFPIKDLIQYQPWAYTAWWNRPTITLPIPYRDPHGP